MPCKSRARSACAAGGVSFVRAVRWYRDDGSNFVSPPISGVTPMDAIGCGPAHVMYQIPDDLPPGHYRVHTDWIVYLNPLRTATISGGDVEVEIVP